MPYKDAKPTLRPASILKKHLLDEKEEAFCSLREISNNKAITTTNWDKMCMPGRQNKQNLELIS